MPSGLRAKARAEREKAAALAAAERERAAAAAARRRALLDRIGARRVTRSRRGRQTGSLAARRRTQVRVVIAIFVVLDVVVWFVVPSWTARVASIAISVLLAPVLYTVLFRRT